MSQKKIHLCEISTKGKFIETECTLMVGMRINYKWAQKNWQGGGDGNVLNLDCGSGCIIL